MEILFAVLHVVTAVFIIGPMAILPMTAMRAARARNGAQVLALARATHTFTLLSLLVFVLGIALGGFIGYRLMGHPDVVGISAATVRDLKAQMHLTDFTGLLPRELFALDNLANWKGWVFLVLGGFLVGFGTRYAGGCTSGHAISGLSNLQWVSLVAVIGFFVGGLLMTWGIYPMMF